MLGGGDVFEETEGWGSGSALQKEGMSPKPLPHSLFCLPLLIQLWSAGVEDMERKKHRMNLKTILLNMFGKTITLLASGRL